MLGVYILIGIESLIEINYGLALTVGCSNTGVEFRNYFSCTVACWSWIRNDSGAVSYKLRKLVYMNRLIPIIAHAKKNCWDLMNWPSF